MLARNRAFGWLTTSRFDSEPAPCHSPGTSQFVQRTSAIFQLILLYSRCIITSRIIAAPLPPKGPQAARLRRRIRHLLNQVQLPPAGLPGSLALSHSRCGKPSCHCADGQGHPAWSLTFMLGGHKHVEKVPPDWVDSVRPRVEQARQFKEAVTEIFTANAQLLALQRDQSRAVAKRQKPRK